VVLRVFCVCMVFWGFGVLLLVPEMFFKLLLESTFELSRSLCVSVNLILNVSS
jgi:hypothetical protein